MPAGAITLADITSADWSLALGAIGEVVQGIADVEQCLGIIVTTPQGSDPLRPTFGANIWRYIDFPISQALPAIVSELTSAITTWEPRVNLVSVTAQPVLDGSSQSGAHLDITLNWQLNLGAAASSVQSTTVSVPGATV
ncbi:GPW/gp25 family protein [Candidatus Binatus sp.]|uniref:GPW/gp25 family protein n=1 Tax=Candidatus Binatus sp. TaxID=2811406 RepID=UPI003C8801DC